MDSGAGKKRSVPPAAGADGQLLYKLLGLHFEYDDRRQVCSVVAPVVEVMLSPGGVVHGGIITYLAHTCMGHLCFRCTGIAHVAVGFNVQFVAPVPPGRIGAEARVVKKGARLLFVECEVKHLGEAGSEALAAKVTGTFYRPAQRP
ncbi:MAG: PaaI family thioesterase [Chloroflexi bacterium]|nr:PaaI family thioesterase [Chloroflexota bacterium]